MRWTVRVYRPPQRGARGYDGGKKIKGRKRPIVVDSHGSVLGVWVSPADVSDARGARVVLEQA
ncbi:MAG: transposase, partial [Armatimonadetes bacterium]|nr:transposase [Armatimonadota bacterium]